MPIHDWTRVEAGIFHHFHHSWIEEIQRQLNGGLLPDDYYARAEQYAAGLGPDVLTLKGNHAKEDGASTPSSTEPERFGNGRAGVVLAPPKARLVVETDQAFYRRKQNIVTVRHVSGDRVVAVVEVVSPGNKGSRSALRSFVEKVAELLEQRIHLLILDLHPPGSRDPQGIPGAAKPQPRIPAREEQKRRATTDDTDEHGYKRQKAVKLQPGQSRSRSLR
jgi:hypothetical protein